MHHGWVERQIREATERGEFDNLAGAGKPLRLGDADDPDWWVKRYVEREGLDASATMPPVLQLRREAAGYPESLVDVAREESVREILADYNRRVVEDRLRPVRGRAMPAVAPRVDVEEMVGRWRDLRAEADARRSVAQAAAAEQEPPPRRPWWRWRPARRNGPGGRPA